MTGTVAGGDDAGVAGASQVVDHDPVLDVQASLGCQLGVGNQAHPDDDEIGRDPLTTPQDHLTHAFVAGHGADLGARPDHDAGVAVDPLVERRDLGCCDPLQHALGGLQDCHVQAESAQGRGCLQADVPAAHDDGVAAGSRQGPDRLDVCEGPKVEHPGQVDTGHVQGAHPATRAQGEMGVAHRGAVVQPHLLRGTIDLRDRRLHQADVVLGVELRLAQSEVLQAARAGEVGLGEGRTVVGQRWLVADHDDLS